MKTYHLLTDLLLTGETAVTDKDVVASLRETAENYASAPDGFIAAVLLALLTKQESWEQK